MDIPARIEELYEQWLELPQKTPLEFKKYLQEQLQQSSKAGDVGIIQTDNNGKERWEWKNINEK